MVDPAVAPYDIGPMPVLLQEAGGRFTDMHGEEGIERHGLATTASCTTSSSASYDPAEPHSTWCPPISSSSSTPARQRADRIVPMGTPHTSAASA